jgi:hypothetical protein
MRRRLSTDRLFHVFSARRSGQHAILGWLMAQMRQPLARLNMCNVPHAIGPYGLKVLGKSARQHLRGLFMNYEDHAPIELERCNGLAGLVEGVDAQQVTPILILRDPFNHLASKRAANPERDIDFGRQEAELWKTYAREYLGETKFIPDKVCINFNEWFSDAAYREQLSNRLNLDYPASSPQAVAAMQAIPPVGCSQFDGRRFDGNAQQMDVLDRWRQRFDDPVYVALLQDEELLALSARIFVMPEVDEWLTKQRTLLAS